MAARYYNEVKRKRGLMRHGAQDDATYDVVWFFTRWGAVKFIEMHSHDKFEVL